MLFFDIACRCLFFILLAAAATATAAPAPSTQPVEHGTARDLPIDMSNATGQTALWLAKFDVPAASFDYTLQLLDADETVRLDRLVFPSPLVSPWPENNIVPAEFYLPTHPTGKIPAAVVLDILDGSAMLPRALARGLAESGIAAVYMPMAGYNQRRPKEGVDIGFFNEDPRRAVDAWRQTVMDIRRAKAILASRPEVDSRHISITGISLGGIVTSLAAGVDGHFDRVVPILAGGDTAALTFSTRETRGIRAILESKHIDVEKLREIMAPVEPLNFASRIDPKRCLMINAANDEVIPRSATEILAHTIGDPQILWTQAGHYSSILYLPAIRATVARYMDGKPVSKIAMTK